MIRSTRPGLEQARTRLIATVAIALAAMGLVGCGNPSAGGGSSVGTAAPTRGDASPRAPTPGLTYIAFGDSWPSGAHCGGCVTFPELYASGLEEQGETVRFIDRTEDGGTSHDLVTRIENNSVVREELAAADIVVISTGANDTEPALGYWQAGTCGGVDNLDCFRTVAAEWQANFEAILAEIGGLRGDRPTAVRLLTNANEFLFDPFLIETLGADFGSVGGAEITAMHHDSICAAADAYDAQCIDLRPVLNGPTGADPVDIHTQESMQKVADALVASGLEELK